MTKSVDESGAPGTSLNEDGLKEDRLEEKSEIIELTDEVRLDGGASSSTHPAKPRSDAHQDGDGEVMEDEFDALTREMPEFRVPHDVAPAEGAPGAAIFSGRRKPGAVKKEGEGTLDASTSPMQGAGAQLGDPESDDSESYEKERALGADTLQLTAVDRDEMERHYYSERLREAALLEDHRFAPDVLICPPRLLTTEWQDGGPLKRTALAAARSDAGAPEVPVADAAPAVVQAESDETQAFDGSKTVQEPESLADFDELHEFDEDELPEIDPDSLEIELDTPEAKPPPKPAAARPGPPPKLPVSATPPPESELGGLVQEILEESAGTAPVSDSGAHPAQSRQKRARNRPRGPRETWFQKVFTDEYFRTLPSDIHSQTRREADFIEASLNLQEGDRLLDLACGFGRHSIELTRRGHEVVGLDLSMHMLQKALNEGQRQELSIKFIHGDMRDLQFEGVFSDCLLWQTSFGFFDDQTNFRVLRGIHRALRPGGELLIEVVNRDHIASRMPHRLWWEGVNCVFLEEVDLDHRTSVLHTKRSFIYEDGTLPLEQSFYIRLYSPHELRHLLHAAGFSVLELSGELCHRGQFLGAASTRVVIRAKKRQPQKGGSNPNK